MCEPVPLPILKSLGCRFWQDLDAHPQVAESFDALTGPARSLGTSNSAKLKPIPSTDIPTSAG